MNNFTVQNMKMDYVLGLIFFGFLLIWPVGAFGAVHELIAEGDRALGQKKIQEAEQFFSKALRLDEDNYRILRSLAEIKVQLEKYKEAETLIAKILSMNVSTQKIVLVKFLDSDSGPLEAELVDETVVPGQSGKNNMRNYLESAAVEIIPFYRLFFLKSGKMKLIQKSKVQIKYLAVPRLVHDEMRELQAKVRNKLIVGSKLKRVSAMVELKGGCFLMGSEKGNLNEVPVHEVCVSSFHLDVYEVTQAEYLMRMGHNPSRFHGADRPVDSVTWVEANSYCKKSGKRLPTEAEWEYAARGGTKTEYYWGDVFDPKQANFCDSSCDLNIRAVGSSDGFMHTAPVGSFPPNPLGLYDVAGNVSEWVADWMAINYYAFSPKDNPQGPGPEEWKVVRGGAWENDARAVRSASRKGFFTEFRIEGVGFRCAGNLS